MFVPDLVSFSGEPVCFFPKPVYFCPKPSDFCPKRADFCPKPSDFFGQNFLWSTSCSCFKNQAQLSPLPAVSGAGSATKNAVDAKIVCPAFLVNYIYASIHDLWRSATEKSGCAVFY